MSRNTTRKRRARVLDVNNRDFLLDEVYPNMNEMITRCVSLQSALFMYLLFRQHLQLDCQGHPRLQEALDAIDNKIDDIWFALYVSMYLLSIWITVDANIGDMTVQEEQEEPFYSPERFRRITDFTTDMQAKQQTNFTKNELRMLLHLFDLPRHGSTVRIQRADGEYDTFHQEELLIFTLIKLKSGESNASVVDNRVGGRSEARWGRGYKWLIHHLATKYNRILSFQGLQRWIDLFPIFAEKIRQSIARPKRHENPETGAVTHIPGVIFQPGTFSIVGFVDCKDYKINVPHTGPAGDFPGATRREGWQQIQQAWYQRHGQKHAVRVLSFCLPNGLTAAVYGPTSARHHDRMLLSWSGIDNLLWNLQYGRPKYCFYGDHAYRGFSRCIRFRHFPALFAPLTPRQRLENVALNRVRTSIEWSYGLVTRKWHLATEPDRFKLETDPEVVMEQVRVLHLLTNCHVCLHGSNVSSRNTFACRPPSLEQYLTV